MRSTVLAAALFLSALGSAADACARKVPGEAVRQAVPAKNINQRLFDAAVRAEVNYHRCRAGVRPVDAGSDRLANVARGHSEWMARSRKLSHKSSVAGRSTVLQRIKSAGQRFSNGAENISTVYRYQLGNRRFKVVDRQNCLFSDRRGNRLPPHSYSSLAKHAVDQWMASPGHRRNILNPALSQLSSAAAFDPRTKYCGQYFLTQNFIG